MKHGCMVMTLRLSSSCRSGSHQSHCGQKKHVEFTAMSSPHWSFFQCARHCPQGICTPGQTINCKFYCEVLKRLREGIWRKCPDKWKNNNWFLHHDNAPSHTSLVVWQFLTSKSITVITPPIHLTSPPVTFSCSTRCNYSWKGIVLTRLRRAKQNRKKFSTHSHLRTSSDAWNHGKHAGIASYMSKVTTSKETVENRSYGKKLFFFVVKFLEFLGSTSYGRTFGSIRLGMFCHSTDDMKFLRCDM